MTYVIGSPCIGVKDKSCVDVCPVDAIHEVDEGADHLFIDPETCIDCDACFAVCPVKAIFRPDDVPEAELPFVEINKAMAETWRAKK